MLAALPVLHSARNTGGADSRFVGSDWVSSTIVAGAGPRAFAKEEPRAAACAGLSRLFQGGSRRFSWLGREGAASISLEPRPSRRGAGAQSRFEHDRDRPVVVELDGHAFPEHAGRDLDAQLSEHVAERLVERLCSLRRRRICEARPGALRRVLSTSGDNRRLRGAPCDSTAT